MTPANLKLTLRNISVPDKSSLNKFLVYIYIYIHIYTHVIRFISLFDSLFISIFSEMMCRWQVFAPHPVCFDILRYGRKSQKERKTRNKSRPLPCDSVPCTNLPNSIRHCVIVLESEEFESKEFESKEFESEELELKDQESGGKYFQANGNDQKRLAGKFPCLIT